MSCKKTCVIIINTTAASTGNLLSSINTPLAAECFVQQMYTTMNTVCELYYRRAMTMTNLKQEFYNGHSGFSDGNAPTDVFLLPETRPLSFRWPKMHGTTARFPVPLPHPPNIPQEMEHFTHCSCNSPRHRTPRASTLSDAVREAFQVCSQMLLSLLN